MNLQEKIHAIANYYGMNVQICKLDEEGAVSEQGGDQ